jgi:3-oxoacyl-[acyl-carrier-protein] synthase III
VTGMRVIGWGKALGEKLVTNDDLAQTLDTSDEWISERTGIRQRYIGGSVASLGTQAAQRALEVAGLSGSDIDMVLLATTTSDQIVPSTAVVIQAALGVTGGALDLNAACSGFAYGMVVANGLLATGMKRIVLIGAEQLSTITDFSDRSTAVLFGDGAGAVVLEATDGPGDLLSSVLGSDGDLKHLLYAEHGGYLQMVGKEVFRKAVQVIVESASEAMVKAGISVDELALMVPHQANLRIIQAACQRLGIDESKAMVTVDKYGNTSAASIPLALVDAITEGRLQRGDLVLLTGFGAGMTWASAILRWNP